jgi:hypothetical protein
MYQRATQEKSIECCKIVKKEPISGLLNPSKETLTFVMQFARVYHVEKQLPASISGLILN